MKTNHKSIKLQICKRYTIEKMKYIKYIKYMNICLIVININI